jgi:hypothetical protein
MKTAALLVWVMIVAQSVRPPVLLAADVSQGQPISPAPVQDKRSGNIVATILQSGSTNSRGYKVTVYDDGSATAEIGPAATALQTVPPQTRHFEAGTVQASKLQALLERIGDVSTIPSGHCAKSVSFGTRTEISYKGKTSGDLQCIRGAAGGQQEALPGASEELSKFVQNMLQQLHINNSRFGVIQQH